MSTTYQPAGSIHRTFRLFLPVLMITASTAGATVAQQERPEPSPPAASPAVPLVSDPSIVDSVGPDRGSLWGLRMRGVRAELYTYGLRTVMGGTVDADIFRSLGALPVSAGLRASVTFSPRQAGLDDAATSFLVFGAAPRLTLGSPTLMLEGWGGPAWVRFERDGADSTAGRSGMGIRWGVDVRWMVIDRHLGFIARYSSARIFDGGPRERTQEDAGLGVVVGLDW